LANFVALVDPDPERSERFLRRVAPLAAPVEGLVTGSCSAGPFTALWTASAYAPVSHVSDLGAAVVLGTPIHGDAGAWVTASELRGVWPPGDSARAAPFDGFYAALTYDPHHGLVAGADLFGRFPVYYFEAGDVLLVGSSPELFRHHPSFRRAFDSLGLVGILLTNGLVEGRTLWKDVRRLDAGHLLAAPVGGPAREIRQYQMPLTDRYFDLPIERQVEVLDAALDRAIRRHVPRGPRPTLLLSGGLDSRTVAGFLARQGISPLAVTRGLRGDIEMQCATRVARQLHFEHLASESDPSHALEDVRTRARWEHLASGFNGSGGWGSHRLLGRLGGPVVSGYSMDWIIGGYAPSTPDLRFEIFFEHQNRWGLRPAVLDRLLRHEVFGDSVREVTAMIERRYRSYSDLEFRRALCFALHHRQRFHIGSHAWSESFGAWPIVPAVDMGVLAVAGGMPASALDERRLQNELVRTRFPELARLPLDRNSYNAEPLVPSFTRRLRRSLKHRTLRVIRRWLPERPPRVERRRYYRQYDFNGPEWMSIRAAAEPWRNLSREYFEPTVLSELLPPAAARPEFEDGITDPAGLKSLIGFLYWLAQNDQPMGGVR
jgi:asparagine synthase (glutamine-hydrolysing)